MKLSQFSMKLNPKLKKSKQTSLTKKKMLKTGLTKKETTSPVCIISCFVSMYDIFIYSTLCFTARVENWINELFWNATCVINEFMVEHDMEIALEIVDGCAHSVNLSSLFRGEQTKGIKTKNSKDILWLHVYLQCCKSLFRVCL